MTPRTFVVVGFGHLEKILDHGDAGVVDHDVHAAKLPNRGGDQRFNLILLADVGHHGQNLPRRAYRFRGFIEAIGINVRDDDFRAFREKTLRRSAPDAARGAGDDRNLIRKLQDILLRFISVLDRLASSARLAKPSPTSSSLREQAASSFALKHAFDTDRHCRGAVGDAILLRARHDLAPATVEHVFKATHHLVLCPEVLLKTLNPLEVADDHTPGVAQNVGDNENPIASLGEYEVGFRRRRPVRAFRNHGALQLCGDFRVDHALDGTGYQDVAAPRQQFHGIDRRLIRAAFQNTMFGDVLDRRSNLEALRIVEGGRDRRFR